MKKSFKKLKTETFEINRQKTHWQMDLDRYMYRQIYLKGNWETDSEDINLNEQSLNDKIKT